MFFGSTIILREFVHQYAKAMDARRLKEKEEVKQSVPILFSNWVVEREARKIYTRNFFTLFQDEYKKTLDLRLQLDKVDRDVHTHIVEELGSRQRKRTITYSQSEEFVLCTYEVVFYSYGEAIRSDIDPLATTRYSELSNISQRLVAKGSKSNNMSSLLKSELLQVEESQTFFQELVQQQQQLISQNPQIGVATSNIYQHCQSLVEMPQRLSNQESCSLTPNIEDSFAMGQRLRNDFSYNQNNNQVYQPHCIFPPYQVLTFPRWNGFPSQSTSQQEFLEDYTLPINYHHNW
ncbi:hypothetical protein FRX31_011205 [Thalictrum thalictroides]|uniref:Uncharacterized protein n=1 Tax=Thalictrum thalictroides TaxID=46969 RepID=A0A7J6WPA7_THATH|nr:hypothetical protein FRX31_011205 [Thalictrum thalictroides]